MTNSSIFCGHYGKCLPDLTLWHATLKKAEKKFAGAVSARASAAAACIRDTQRGFRHANAQRVDSSSGVVIFSENRLGSSADVL